MLSFVIKSYTLIEFLQENQDFTSTKLLTVTILLSILFLRGGKILYPGRQDTVTFRIWNTVVVPDYIHFLLKIHLACATRSVALGQHATE